MKNETKRLLGLMSLFALTTACGPAVDPPAPEAGGLKGSEVKKDENAGNKNSGDQNGQNQGPVAPANLDESRTRIETLENQLSDLGYVVSCTPPAAPGGEPTCAVDQGKLAALQHNLENLKKAIPIAQELQKAYNEHKTKYPQAEELVTQKRKIALLDQALTAAKQNHPELFGQKDAPKTTETEVDTTRDSGKVNSSPQNEKKEETTTETETTTEQTETEVVESRDGHATQLESLETVVNLEAQLKALGYELNLVEKDGKKSFVRDQAKLDKKYEGLKGEAKTAALKKVAAKLIEFEAALSESLNRYGSSSSAEEFQLKLAEVKGNLESARKVMPELFQ